MFPTALNRCFSCQNFLGQTPTMEGKRKTSAPDIVKNCVGRGFEYPSPFQTEHRVSCVLVQKRSYTWGLLKLWFCCNKFLPCPGLWESKTRHLQIENSRMSQPGIEAPAFNGTLIDFPAGGMFGKWFLKRPCSDFGWSLGKESHHMFLAI